MPLSISLEKEYKEGQDTFATKGFTANLGARHEDALVEELGKEVLLFAKVLFF